ncbi:TetR/AcrR family transcriptional regulator [Mycolicibacterium anyangense]|uniref:TetR/AcrR family transcriptional regulator n=1 Tax=Mycolicibacterium anyangense TaxID=1431246 RepID=UPI001FE8524A|nr:TetR/AcrR family transcriptional regulator [Mycolicibacterium anyangense]
MAGAQAQSPRRGRPRSASVRSAIVGAAVDLALAGGPAAASVDAIAKRAGVSRTTIYKWWPSSASIVLEGLLESVQHSIVRPPGSSSAEALHHHVRELNRILSHPPTGPLLRNVIAAAASDPAITCAVLDQWIVPRRDAAAEILRAAVAAGELSDDIDIEVAVDALVSPPYYRLTLGMEPLDDAAVSHLTDTVWRGLRR